MAVTYGFFNSLNGDRAYNANQIAQYFDGLISDGVYENIGGALRVLVGTGMNVNVQSGRAIINCKWISSDAVVTLPITAAHVTLNRYTAVVVQLDVTNRQMSLTTVDGTPATSPIQPKMTNTETLKQLCLAMVYVEAGATSITGSNITDMRASSSCGWVTGLIRQVDTSELFLQWQTAYEEFYAQMQSWFTNERSDFDDWYEDLTEDLQVNTYIDQYHKFVQLGASDSRIIPLNMNGYTYDANDVFFITFNGLAAAENTDYILDATMTPPQIHVNMTGSAGITNDVDIKVLKSKIGYTS